MKKLILTLAIGAIGFTASAQDEFQLDVFYPPEVPKEVQAKFEKLHPGIEDVSWEVEKGNYEAEFEMNDKENTIVMDPMGNVLYTEAEIASQELPASALDYLNREYPGKRISDVLLITDERGKITYEAEVKRDDLLFDENGTLIGEI